MRGPWRARARHGCRGSGALHSRRGTPRSDAFEAGGRTSVDGGAACRGRRPRRRRRSARRSAWSCRGACSRASGSRLGPSRAAATAGCGRAPGIGGVSSTPSTTARAGRRDADPGDRVPLLGEGGRVGALEAPPAQWWRRTGPSEAAKSRPRRNRSMGGATVSTASPPIRPTPGIVRGRRGVSASDDMPSILALRSLSRSGRCAIRSMSMRRMSRARSGMSEPIR